jgi:hypothetical protein
VESRLLCKGVMERRFFVEAKSFVFLGDGR